MALGIKIASGFDASGAHGQGRNVEELVALNRRGMSPWMRFVPQQQRRGVDGLAGSRGCSGSGQVRRLDRCGRRSAQRHQRYFGK